MGKRRKWGARGQEPELVAKVLLQPLAPHTGLGWLESDAESSGVFLPQADGKLGSCLWSTPPFLP